MLREFEAFVGEMEPGLLPHQQQAALAGALDNAPLFHAVDGRNAYILNPSSPEELLRHALRTLHPPHTLERALAHLHGNIPHAVWAHDEYLGAWDAICAGAPGANFAFVVHHSDDADADRAEYAQLFTAPTVLEAPIYQNLLKLAPWLPAPEEEKAGACARAR